MAVAVGERKKTDGFVVEPKKTDADVVKELVAAVQAAAVHFVNDREVSWGRLLSVKQ